MLLYLDSCVVIDYVEQHPQLFARIDERISHADSCIVVSDLTRLECLVRPLRQGDTIRLEQFKRFFAAPDLNVIWCSRGIFDLAAKLRARHGLKTPDALHLAAAIETGCDEFWTHDDRLNKAAKDHLDTVIL
jgi:predicted nucleic acid-binding protein